MLAPLELKPIDLEARTVHRIQNPSGQEVFCVRGLVWVTQAHDARGIMLAAIRGLMGTPQTQEARDIILASGQSAVLNRRGLAVVFAFEDAMITVGAPLRLSAAGGVRVKPHRNVRSARSSAWRGSSKPTASAISAAPNTFQASIAVLWRAGRCPAEEVRDFKPCFRCAGTA